jgi:hypothetical protein
MWSPAEITVVIDESDPPIILARITTPIGVVDLIGSVRLAGDTLHIDSAHIGGLKANVLGIAGLNAIGRKLLEEADVAQIVIQGGTRTSGRCEGRIPRVIRFPRGKGNG